MIRRDNIRAAAASPPPGAGAVGGGGSGGGGGASRSSIALTTTGRFLRLLFSVVYSSTVSFSVWLLRRGFSSIAQHRQHRNQQAHQHHQHQLSFLSSKKRCVVASVLVTCFLVMVTRNLFAFNTMPPLGESNDQLTPTTKQQRQQQDNKDKNNRQQATGDASSCGSPARSVKDIQRCYPPKREVRLQLQQRPGECSVVENWEQVQRCLTGRFADEKQHNLSEDMKSFEIHVIGERHSGTKFLVSDIQRCFKSMPNIKVHRDFIRSKHFFQPILADDKKDYTRSIVVAVFRDPVDWVAAMHEKPYHSPNHIKGFGALPGGTAAGDEIIPLPWKDFVTRYWLTKRSQQDLDLIQTGQHVKQTNSCAGVEHFAFNEVVPCEFGNRPGDGDVEIPESRLRGFWPVYELRRDGSGKPFQNVLELRREKIVNFLLEIPLLYGSNLGGYVAVRYEDLVKNGTEYLLEELSAMVGLGSGGGENAGRLPEGCVPSKGQPDKFLSQRYIPSGFRDWILEHIDHDVEKLLGYYDEHAVVKPG